MIKSWILSSVMTAVCFSAQALTLPELIVQQSVAPLTSEEAGIESLNLKVGDTANYKLNLGSLINGSMVMKVTEVAPEQVTISQDMDLGFAGKQSCQIKLNPNTGETTSLVCNGQNQKPGDRGDIELIETKEDTVTVPAGTFRCVYIRARQKSQNQEIQQWAAPREVPVFGMVKSLAPSQMGEVKIELKSFQKM